MNSSFTPSEHVLINIQPLPSSAKAELISPFGPQARSIAENYELLFNVSVY
jgi:hypothetical protein